MNSKMIVKLFFVISIINIILFGHEYEKKYHIGGYSAPMIGEMRLSQLNSSFDDLPSDGVDGPHCSGLYFTYSWKKYLRIGMATLVTNSAVLKRTTYDIQGAGPLAEFIYGNKIILFGGMHMGALILDAMQRDGDSEDSNVETGTYYKSEGLFNSPFIGVGIKLKSYELRFFVKSLNIGMALNENDDISVFNSTYVGINYNVNF